MASHGPERRARCAPGAHPNPCFGSGAAPGPRSGAGWIGALGAASLLASCAPPPRVELAGCAELDARGCRLNPDGALVLWVEGPQRVSVEQGTVEGPEAVDGGQRWRLRAGPGALWAGQEISLLPARPPDDADAALAKLRAGDRAGAEALLAEVGDPARAASVEARLALHAGDVDAAITAWERAGAARDDTLALLWTLRAHRRAPLPALRARLEALPVDPRDGDTAARRAYHLGLMWRDDGEARPALDLLAEAATRAARLGMERTERDARAARAALLAELGRLDEADAELGAAPAPQDPCEEAELHTNRGWVRWLRWSAGRGPLDETSFERAVALHRTACPRTIALANAELNAGLAAWAGGRHADAQAALDRALAAHAAPPAEVRAWADELAARLAVAAGRPAEAAARWRRMEADAASAGLEALAWRAACGLAELAPAEEAVEAWRRAEARLDALAAAVPLGEGRGTLLTEADRSARGLVDALLTAGAPEAALEAARLARRRSLAALPWSRAGEGGGEARLAWQQARAQAAAEAATDWALTGPEAAARRAARAAALVAARRAALDALDLRGWSTGPLPPLTDLTLVVAPLPEGAALFVVDGGQVRALRAPDVRPDADPSALSRALLDPLDAPLERAARVRLLATGDWADVELHALPWRGAPLHRQRPVVWTLDRPAAARRAGGPALVVGDPRGDLPWARREAEAVGGQLGIQPLLGTEASWSTVYTGLDGAGVAHLAAHGEGVGWSSALRLAGGALDVADVLTLRAAPARVVLSACGAGQEFDGVGLAQAFILAGSAQVVAARGRVADEATAALGPQLHAHSDLAEALRGATGDTSGWRVYEP
jgi:hypothetical protein